MNKKICVFCGARFGNDAIYKDIATELGKELARRGHTLVYGGGSAGLMGAVANGILDEDGRVIGVFPRFLEAKEVSHKSGVELTYVDTMDERKVFMYGGSDGAITIPGGFGTMDEFFEVLTLKQIGQYDKPIGLPNIRGYYDPLITSLHHMVEAGFVSVEHLDYFYTRDNIGDLLDAMGL